MTYTVGSLFAGIGGFDLGFERANFKTAWQVEIDPYCLKVLAKNFPHAERYADIRECGAHNLKPVDVICGGFPCQDISNAGLRDGIDGERSGLWREMHRVIGELRPHYVVVENVAALLVRGFDRVLGDLSEIGYDAEWEIISAADVGAPHLRKRVWIVAYPKSEQRERGLDSRAGGFGPTDGGKDLADPFCVGQPRPRVLDYASDQASHRQGKTGDAEYVCLGDQWTVEPDVGRVANGVSKRVDRLRALGNAVVPQIPELIARRIFAALQQENECLAG